MVGRRRLRFGRRRNRPAPPARPRPAAGVVPLGGSLPRHDGAEGHLEVEPGVALWFRVLGSGPSTVVVPTTGNHADLARLGAPTRTVVFYDVRGRGRSDAVPVERAGFDAEVGDLGVVVAALGGGPASVVATSYHAGVAAAVAATLTGGVGRLVLAAAVPVRSGARPGPARQPAPHQLAHLDQLQAGGAREVDPAGLCRAWREVYVPLLMGRPEAFATMADVCDLPNEHPWAVARSLVHVFGDLGDYDWRPRLRGLGLPTLVVHGAEDQDPVDYAVEWVDALPEGRLLELAGVGQLPWVEDPDGFFGPVGRFLDGEAI